MRDVLNDILNDKFNDIKLLCTKNDLMYLNIKVSSNNILNYDKITKIVR